MNTRMWQCPDCKTQNDLFWSSQSFFGRADLKKEKKISRELKNSISVPAFKALILGDPILVFCKECSAKHSVKIETRLSLLATKEKAA